MNSENTKRFNILIIDSEDDASLISNTLEVDYNVFVVSSKSEAIDVLSDNNINIIIFDLNLEEAEGVEILDNILKIAPNAIRVLVTECSDSKILINAINKAKIYRYIKKPCNSSELKLVMNSISEYLSLKEENDKLIFDLKKLFTGTIGAITDALDGKNPYIFGKSRRVAFCAIKLAQYIGLSEEEVSKIDLAGLLHDIGMIGIPERVLNKSGKFSMEEKMILKQHVENGISILKDIKQLKDILDIIKYHHEQYDGNGYPYGLKGEEIPLSSRILAVADAYDGLISDRAYRKGFTHEEAVERLKQREGLDPNLVKKFIEVMNSSIVEFKVFEEELKHL